MTFLPTLVAGEKGFFPAKGVEAYCVQVQAHSRRTLPKLVDSWRSRVPLFFNQPHGARAWRGPRAQVFVRDDVDEVPWRGAAWDSLHSRSQGKKSDVRGKRSNTDHFASSTVCALESMSNLFKVTRVGRINDFEDPTISAVFARSQLLYWGTKAGFQPLYYPEPGMGWYEGGLAGGVSLITQHPDLVQKVVSAVVQATAFIKNNEKEAVGCRVKEDSSFGSKRSGGKLQNPSRRFRWPP